MKGLIRGGSKLGEPSQKVRLDQDICCFTEFPLVYCQVRRQLIFKSERKRVWGDGQNVKLTK